MQSGVNSCRMKDLYSRLVTAELYLLSCLSNMCQSRDLTT